MYNPYNTNNEQLGKNVCEIMQFSIPGTVSSNNWVPYALKFSAILNKGTITKNWC